MKNVLTLNLTLVLLFNICLSKTEYDKKFLGTWIGTIIGSGLATKNSVIVITKSNYISNNTVHWGICEGYNLVNNDNKTTFKGKIIVEVDMPIIEVNEPNTSTKMVYSIWNLVVLKRMELIQNWPVVLGLLMIKNWSERLTSERNNTVPKFNNIWNR